MNSTGSGGLGAVSIGLTESVIGLVVLALLLFGVWKLGQLIWAAFSS